jgi:hypothetical protein
MTDDKGYRPLWLHDVLGERSLLDCALDVHMTVTGAMERRHGEEGSTQEDDIRALQHTLIHWKPSLAGTESFDNAVKNLIKTALREAYGE